MITLTKTGWWEALGQQVEDEPTRNTLRGTVSAFLASRNGNPTIPPMIFFRALNKIRSNVGTKLSLDGEELMFVPAPMYSSMNDPPAYRLYLDLPNGFYDNVWRYVYTGKAVFGGLTAYRIASFSMQQELFILSGDKYLLSIKPDAVGHSDWLAIMKPDIGAITFPKEP